jgi:hypothetical protein
MLVYDHRSEIYDMGIVRLALYGVPHQGKIYVFYEYMAPGTCRTKVQCEEQVHFFSERTDANLLDRHLQQRYVSHPCLQDLDNYPVVVKRTDRRGRVSRRMQLRFDGTRIPEIPCDLSSWPARVMRKLHLLPSHVRDVYGI